MSCFRSAAPTAVCCRAEVVTHAAKALIEVADLPPGLVVLVADDSGVLMATRDADFGVGPSDVESVCARLLDVLPPDGPADAMVVSLDPCFEAGSPAVSQAWRDMRRRFERSHITLVDWWLVTGSSTTSVAVACSEPVS